MKRTHIIVITLLTLAAVAGVLAYRAISRHRQQKDLATAQATHTLAAYENYIQQYPRGLYLDRARSLLQQRRKELEAKFDYWKLVVALQDKVKTYFASFNGVTEAPSGISFGLAMLQIQATLTHPENANPEFSQELSRLESLLKSGGRRTRSSSTGRMVG